MSPQTWIGVQLNLGIYIISTMRSACEGWRNFISSCSLRTLEQAFEPLQLPSTSQPNVSKVNIHIFDCWAYVLRANGEQIPIGRKLPRYVLCVWNEQRTPNTSQVPYNFSPRTHNHLRIYASRRIGRHYMTYNLFWIERGTSA